MPGVGWAHQKGCARANCVPRRCARMRPLYRRLSLGPFEVVGERVGQMRQAELGRGGTDPGSDQLTHALSFGSMARLVVKGRVPVIWS